MKKQISLMAFALSALMLCSGCGGSETQVSQGYLYKKQSANKLYFYSSDEKLDTFLNDFYTRHSRAEEETAINAMPLGEGGTAWKAWETMSLVWFDSSTKNFREDSFTLLKQWLYGAPVDDYGYCWSAMASLEQVDQNPLNNMFGMGWPFPNYDGSNYYDWEFNGYKADDTEGWKMETDGTVISSKIGGGLFANTVENFSEISFSRNMGNYGIQTKESPYFEMDIRWCVDGNFTQNDVDDIYLSWQVRGSDEWYTVKASDYTARSVAITANYANHLYMPMYLHENWGTDKEVTAVKVAVKAKEDKVLNGEVNLNYVRGNYDSRQIDNGFNLVEAAKLYYEFTGDRKVLEDTLNRCREVVMFMAYNLGGENGLVDLSHFVGHNGGVIADGVAETIASSYWDVLSMSPKSLYAQVLYYQTLQNLAYLEKAAAQENIVKEAPTIKRTAGGTVEYSFTADTLLEMANRVAKEVQKPVDTANKTGFFDTKKGRFIEGFNKHGNVVDYGSTIFNNMVVAAGMATQEQSEQVVAWISGERIVESDDATGYTGDPDEYLNYGIYDYEFAPRTTTVKNYEQYTTGHYTEASKSYGASCQDGGAILFTSYYDMMARLQTEGAENAYSRLKGIRDWYLKIYDYAQENGYGGAQFYRSYYMSEIGLSLQGMGTAGSLGLDAEFIESAIVYSVVPFGFFGLESVEKGTLSVSPQLPGELSFWRMENLMFGGVRYDLEVGKDYVILESVRGNTDGLKCTLNIPTKSETPKVYQNGKLLPASGYKVENGNVVITVEFRGQKIQVQ